MDALVTAVLKYAKNPSAGELDTLVKKFDGNMKMLKKNAAQIDNILQTITPSQHTYGYLCFLSARCSADVKDHNQFVEQCRTFMLEAESEQLRRGPKLLGVISHKFVESLRLADNWIRGVHPLRAALDKLTYADPSTLTPVHADFVCVCLKAKAYDIAKPLLDMPIYEVDPKGNGLDSADYLAYFYYGGLVNIGLKRFDRAAECFQCALTVPSAMLSAIQIESFKRFVLTSLLVHGELQRPPEKLTSHVVARNVDRLCGVYMDLSRAYRRGPEEFGKLMNANYDLLKKERTLGLAKQCLKALIRSNIQRLTKTYVTLSLAEMASLANLGSAAEAEGHLLKMIEDGDIFASISQEKGMVSFLEDPEEYDTTRMVKELDSKVREVAGLTERLQEIDRDIQLSELYITKTQPQLLGGGPGGNASGGRGGEDDDLKMAMAASLADRS